MKASALASTGRRIAAALRFIIGVPDYDAYVAHLRARHPEKPVPSRAAFHAERQQARYRSGGGRCC